MGVGSPFPGDDGIVARQSRMSRSGSGSGIFVQGDYPARTLRQIIGNICSGGSSGYDGAQGGRWWSVSGFEIWAADSVICNNTAHDNDGGGFAIGGQNSIVIGNKAYNNGRGGSKKSRVQRAHKPSTRGYRRLIRSLSGTVLLQSGLRLQGTD